MAKLGRPTVDPKRGRVTLRLADRDLVALRAIARERKVPLAEAARQVLRAALGVPDLPESKRRRS